MLQSLAAVDMIGLRHTQIITKTEFRAWLRKYHDGKEWMADGAGDGPTSTPNQLSGQKIVLDASLPDGELHMSAKTQQELMLCGVVK